MNKVSSYGNLCGIFGNTRFWKNNFCLIINRQLKCYDLNMYVFLQLPLENN